MAAQRPSVQVFGRKVRERYDLYAYHCESIVVHRKLQPQWPIVPREMVLSKSMENHSL